MKPGTVLSRVGRSSSSAAVTATAISSLSLKATGSWLIRLNGRSEGWPAPGPEAVVYLAEKGIRCVGTDGPTLGGAGPAGL